MQFDPFLHFGFFFGEDLRLPLPDPLEEVDDERFEDLLGERLFPFPPFEGEEFLFEPGFFVPAGRAFSPLPRFDGSCRYLHPLPLAQLPELSHWKQ